MSAFIVNSELSQDELWHEVQKRQMYFADTLDFVLESDHESRDLAGVLGLLRDYFSEIQELTEMIKPKADRSSGEATTT